MNLKTLAPLTTQITVAYLRGPNGQLDRENLESLIKAISESLSGVVSEVSETESSEPITHRRPAVPIDKSVTPDFIICLEDGRHFKCLTRHIGAKYGLTPDTYRIKWGLSLDYPMTAPNYSKKRAEMALQNGLGTHARREQYGRPRLAAAGGIRR
jgi:predicted transcriptional regulator